MNGQRYTAAVIGVVLILSAGVAIAPGAGGDIAVPTGPAPGGAPSAETQYFAVMLSGKKIGHAVNTLKVDRGKVVSDVKMVLQLRRQLLNLEVAVTSGAVETLEGKPLSFTYDVKASTMGQTVDGRIDKGGTLHVTITSGGQKRTREMAWPKGAILNYGMQLVSRQKGLKAGTTYTVRSFDPDALAARDTKVTVGKRKKVNLLGRVAMLTEVRSVMVVGGSSMTVLGYVDAEANALKTVMTMIGMKMELIACGRKVALGDNDVLDMFDHVLLASPKPLNNLDSTSSVSYVMAPTKAGAKLVFPTTDNQAVKTLGGGRVGVTVSPVAMPNSAAMPYKGADAEALAAIKPSRFVQSDNAKVVALARKAVGRTENAAQAARRVEKFVNGYISKKTLSVGYATAAEVAETREGDCTEHAVLTAAMCRAVGIPARVVMGMAYVSEFAGRRHVFGPHAWNEAYVGGKWIGLDSALGGYDAGHVALAYGDGNSDSLFALVNTLGCFRIVSVEAHPAPRRPERASRQRRPGRGAKTNRYIPLQKAVDYRPRMRRYFLKNSTPGRVVVSPGPLADAL